MDRDQPSGGPGLQPQRTALAWTRTAIGCAGLALLLVRQAVARGRGVDVVAAVLAGVAAVSVFGLARLRRNQIAARLAGGRSPLVPWPVVAVTVLVCGVALGVLFSVAIDAPGR